METVREEACSGGLFWFGGTTTDSAGNRVGLEDGDKAVVRLSHWARSPHPPGPARAGSGLWESAPTGMREEVDDEVLE